MRLDSRGRLVPRGYPFFRYIGEVEIIPHGYGLCWRNFDRLSATVCPVPFNLVAWYLRLTWTWLIWGFAYYPSWLRRARICARRAYRRGVEDGKSGRRCN